GLAGLGVDREQPRIHGPLDDAGAAGLVGRRIWNGVIGDAAAGRAIRDVAIADLRIVAPDLATAERVDGDDDVARRAQIEAGADLDRGRFGRILALERAVVGQVLRQVPGPVFPHLGQLADVVGGDLVEGRVARLEVGTAIDRPVLARGSGGDRADGGRSRRRLRHGRAVL